MNNNIELIAVTSWRESAALTAARLSKPAEDITETTEQPIIDFRLPVLMALDHYTRPNRPELSVESADEIDVPTSEKIVIKESVMDMADIDDDDEAQDREIRKSLKDDSEQGFSSDPDDIVDEKLASEDEEDEDDDESLLERLSDSDIDLNAIYPLICHGKDNDDELEQQQVLDFLEKIKWDEDRLDDVIVLLERAGIEIGRASCRERV